MVESTIEERDGIFQDSVKRLAEMASRAILILDRDPKETAVVAIHVDDPDWTDLAEALMPGEDWDRYREQGMKPIARGSVTWSVVQYICTICPDVSGVLEREMTPGHLYAFVCAAGGVSVFEVPYTGMME